MNQSKAFKNPFVLSNAGDLVQALGEVKKARNWRQIYDALKRTARHNPAPTIRVKAQARRRANDQSPEASAIFERYYLGFELVYKFDKIEMV